jgi:transposase-like protein
LQIAATPGQHIRFLGKALKTMRHWPPSSINTDQLGSYPKAIRRLKREGKLSDDTEHRTCKYLNNIIEADHGALKRVIRPNPELSDDEDSSRHDQRLRSDAHDPASHVSRTSKMRSISSTSCSTSSLLPPNAKEPPAK